MTAKLSLCRRVFASVTGFALVLVVLGAGCTARSGYLRQEAPDAELVWAFDDGLELRTGDNRPVAKPPSWEGLRDRVACVPEAAAFAARAEDDAQLGTWLVWGGLAAALGGAGALFVVGALAAVLALGAPAVALVILAVTAVGMGAAAGGGVILSAVGGYFRRRALPEALDAVNAYNDAFLEEPACRSGSAKSPAGHDGADRGG